MSLNPYESPLSAPAANSLAAEPPLVPFFAWERLRLWYNLTLTGVVLLVAIPLREVVLTERFIGFVLQGAVGANICFCVGLVAEFYLRWFGLWGNSLRMLMFVIGTGLSVLATVGGLFLTLAPPM